MNAWKKAIKLSCQHHLYTRALTREKQTTRLTLVTSLNPAPDFDFNSTVCVTLTLGCQSTHQPFVLFNFMNPMLKPHKLF